VSVDYVNTSNALNKGIAVFVLLLVCVVHWKLNVKYNVLAVNENAGIVLRTSTTEQDRMLNLRSCAKYDWHRSLHIVDFVFKTFECQSFFLTVCPLWARGNYPLIPSLPHLLLYLSVAFTFPFFLSYSLYLFSFFSIPYYSTIIVQFCFQAACYRRRLNLSLLFCWFCVICIFS